MSKDLLINCFSLQGKQTYLYYPNRVTGNLKDPGVHQHLLCFCQENLSTIFLCSGIYIFVVYSYSVFLVVTNMY